MKPRNLADKADSRQLNVRKKKPSSTAGKSENINGRSCSVFDYASSDDELFDKKSTNTTFRKQRSNQAKKPDRRKRRNKNSKNSCDTEVCNGEPMNINIENARKVNEFQLSAGCSNKENSAANERPEFVDEIKEKTDYSKESKLDCDKELEAVPSKVCPVCENCFPGSESDAEFSRHVNSCLDAVHTGDLKTKDIPVSATKNDEEYARQLQNREQEKEMEEDLSGRLFFCSFCQKDLTKFSSRRRSIHINKCADVHEKNVLITRKAEKKLLKQENGALFECIICGMHFSNMASRISHMKQCCKEKNASRKELLYLMKAEQENSQSNGNGTDLVTKKSDNTNSLQKSADNNENIGISSSSSVIPVLNSLPIQETRKLKKSRKKRRRNEEVPEILTRSEEEARSLLAKKAERFLEDQLQIDDKSLETATSLPVSRLARKYDYKAGEQMSLTSENTTDDSQCLWSLASINLCPSNVHKFYVEDIFEEDYESTKKIMDQKNMKEASLEVLNFGNTNDRPKHSSSPEEIVQQSQKHEHSKVEYFNGSFSLTQQEKCAVLEKLGLDDDDNDPNTHKDVPVEENHNDEDSIQCSGFFKTKDSNETKINERFATCKSNATESFINDMRLLLNNDCDKDVKIFCADGEEIKAHSLILMLRCPKIFEGADKSKIDLKSSSKAAVEQFLLYLYTGDIEFDASLAGELSELSERFSLGLLKEASCAMLADADATPMPCQGKGIAFKTVINDLWANDESDKESTQDLQNENNSEFDENDAEDLRFFFATQKEKRLIEETEKEAENDLADLKILEEPPCVVSEGENASDFDSPSKGEGDVKKSQQRGTEVTFHEQLNVIDEKNICSFYVDEDFEKKGEFACGGNTVEHVQRICAKTEQDSKRFLTSTDNVNSVLKSSVIDTPNNDAIAEDLVDIEIVEDQATSSPLRSPRLGLEGNASSKDLEETTKENVGLIVEGDICPSPGCNEENAKPIANESIVLRHHNKLSHRLSVNDSQRDYSGGDSVIYVSPVRGTPKMIENSFMTPAVDHQREFSFSNGSKLETFNCTVDSTVKDKGLLSEARKPANQSANSNDSFLNRNFSDLDSIEGDAFSPCVTASKHTATVHDLTQSDDDDDPIGQENRTRCNGAGNLKPVASNGKLTHSNEVTVILGDEITESAGNKQGTMGNSDDDCIEVVNDSGFMMHCTFTNSTSGKTSTPNKRRLAPRTSDWHSQADRSNEILTRSPAKMVATPERKRRRVNESLNRFTKHGTERENSPRKAGEIDVELLHSSVSFHKTSTKRNSNQESSGYQLNYSHERNNCADIRECITGSVTDSSRPFSLLDPKKSAGEDGKNRSTKENSIPTPNVYNSIFMDLSESPPDYELLKSSERARSGNSNVIDKSADMQTVDSCREKEESHSPMYSRIENKHPDRLHSDLPTSKPKRKSFSDTSLVGLSANKDLLCSKQDLIISSATDAGHNADCQISLLSDNEIEISSNSPASDSSSQSISVINTIHEQDFDGAELGVTPNFSQKSVCVDDSLTERQSFNEVTTPKETETPRRDSVQQGIDSPCYKPQDRNKIYETSMTQGNCNFDAAASSSKTGDMLGAKDVDDEVEENSQDKTEDNEPHDNADNITFGSQYFIDDCGFNCDIDNDFNSMPISPSYDDIGCNAGRRLSKPYSADEKEARVQSDEKDVEPVDEFAVLNPESNAELLDSHADINNSNDVIVIGEGNISGKDDVDLEGGLEPEGGSDDYIDASNEDSDDVPPRKATKSFMQVEVLSKRTPTSALRNFGPGCGIHPETGNPITPMSDYDALATPILVKRVKQYGIRKLAKRKMAGKMRVIYKMKHGFNNWEEPPPKLQRKKKNVKNKNSDEMQPKVVNNPQKDTEEEEYGSEQSDCSVSSSDDERRKTFEGPGESEEFESASQASQAEGDGDQSLFDKLTKFILDRRDLYEKVLTYQKFDLNGIYKLVKDAGIKCSKNSLTDFLDKQCVCYICPRTNDQGRTRGRRGRKAQKPGP